MKNVLKATFLSSASSNWGSSHFTTKAKCLICKRTGKINISLKKENGEWKVWLLSTGMHTLGEMQKYIEANP